MSDQKEEIDHGRRRGMARARDDEEIDHAFLIVERPIDQIKPSPENLQLYRPVAEDDPEVIALADSIRRFGIKEPILVTFNLYIISGHRRHTAARLAGLRMVPCRIANVLSSDPDFLRLLRECNRQRFKGLDEIVREELVSADPEDAHRALIEHRQHVSQIDAPDAIEIGGRKRRAQISDAQPEEIRKTPEMDDVDAGLFQAMGQVETLRVRLDVYRVTHPDK